MLPIVMCVFRFVRLLGSGHQAVAVENLAFAAAVDRLQDEAQTAGGDAIGSAVPGRPVPGLERLASRAGLRSTGHCGRLATGTSSEIWGRLSRPNGPRQGRPAVASEVRRLIRQPTFSDLEDVSPESLGADRIG
jgi:hypothetical protein